MYKIPSKQLTFEDFDQPVGMKLELHNCWVKAYVGDGDIYGKNLLARADGL